MIGALIAQNIREVLTRAHNAKALPRDVADALAREESRSPCDCAGGPDWQFGPQP